MRILTNRGPFNSLSLNRPGDASSHLDVDLEKEEKPKKTSSNSASSTLSKRNKTAEWICKMAGVSFAAYATFLALSQTRRQGGQLNQTNQQNPHPIDRSLGHLEQRIKSMPPGPDKEYAKIIPGSKDLVLNKYGAFIDQDKKNACENVGINFVNQLPSRKQNFRVSGRFNRKNQEILLVLDGDPQRRQLIFAHEYLHCITSQNFYDTLKNRKVNLAKSHPEFAKKLKTGRGILNKESQTFINEGITQYFTMKLFKLPETHGYSKNLKFIEKLIEKGVTEEKLKKAYFSGEENAIDEVIATATAMLIEGVQ